VILNDIAASARIRVEKAKALRSAEAVRDAALTQAALSAPAADARLPFEQALAAEGLSFICEVKRASPSRRLIAADTPDFPYPEIAAGYETAGAAALSVLTEPDYFLGSDRYLRDIAAKTLLPVLRKDFIVDPYQIYEAKLLGASAVLLICVLLDTKTLEAYIGTADSLGLSALVEAHNGDEVRSALDGGFVNAEVDLIAELRRDGVISLAQLHGTEDAAYIEALREASPALPVIKAVRAESREAVLKAAETGADYLLLDHGKGGAGESFDWALLEGGKFLASLPVPCFLAGGITVYTATEALALKPFGIDVSSGAETGALKTGTR
jgi:indole-3-glycerol phosphate synthase